MSEPSNVLRGILHPDGTLELAARPTLPAGEVEVTIRPVMPEAKGVEMTNRPDEPEKKREGWFESMQRARAELEASGAVFRAREEIDADIAEMRDWDSRLDEIRRQAETGRSSRSTGPDEATNRRATSRLPGETLSESMQRSRAEMEASGYDFFRTKEEVDAYIEDLRDWDGKVDEVYRQIEEGRERDTTQ